MSHMNKVGIIEPGEQFERLHGLKYVQHGLKTAFLPDVNAIHMAITSPAICQSPHIGQQTYAKHGMKIKGVSVSAYELRGTAR